MNVRERLEPAEWSLAGIVISPDRSNFWLLGLTSAPDGSHSVDFLENCEGIWQAQEQGHMRLEYQAHKDRHIKWAYGRDYRLRLDLDKDGITGAVSDPVTSELLAHGRYRFRDAKAVRTGVAGLIIRDCAALFDDVSIAVPKDGKTDLEIDIERGASGNVAILKDRLPGLDHSTVDHLAKALRASGFGVTLISADSATDPRVLSPENFRLYVIPNAQVYPADGIPPLMNYLRRRGNAVILGTPAFSRPAWPYEGEWIDIAAIRERIAETKPERVLVDFADTDPATWVRSSNDFNAPGSIEVVDGGPDDTAECLKIWSGDFTGWDTYCSPVIRDMFPEGHGLLCFWAKGDRETPELSVEMNERDGSRWIAVAPIKTEWTHHVLTPNDFKHWPDAKPKKKRGTPGDRLNVTAAVKITFGIAHSHTGKVKDGSHTFWIDGLGTAPNPFAKFLEESASANALIETVCPPYKVYPLRGVVSLRANPHQVLTKGADRLPVPDAAFSSIARPQGKGFGHRRKWRWIPLLDALDASGARRGSPFWMLIHRSFRFNGATTAALAVNDSAFMTDEGVTRALVDVAHRICNGVFFAEAGSTKFSCWPDETVKLGRA